MIFLIWFYNLSYILNVLEKSLDICLFCFPCVFHKGHSSYYRKHKIKSVYGLQELPSLIQQQESNSKPVPRHSPIQHILPRL